MDKALVLGTKDCRFESCQGHHETLMLARSVDRTRAPSFVLIVSWRGAVAYMKLHGERAELVSFTRALHLEGLNTHGRCTVDRLNFRIGAM